MSNMKQRLLFAAVVLASFLVTIAIGSWAERPAPAHLARAPLAATATPDMPVRAGELQASSATNAAPLLRTTSANASRPGAPRAEPDPQAPATSPDGGSADAGPAAPEPHDAALPHSARTR
jgi:hypothetical protein